MIEKLCYVGSTVKSDVRVDEDTARLAKASHAFDRFSKRLWDDHSIHLDTKISSVYTLLSSCPSFSTSANHGPFTLLRKEVTQVSHTQSTSNCLSTLAGLLQLTGHRDG